MDSELEQETGPDQAKAAGTGNIREYVEDGDALMRFVRHEQRCNLMRTACFGDLKLRSPLWDMLVDLLASDWNGTRISVSDLCMSCDAPDSTAMRLINQLVEKGYALKQADDQDRRRTWVLLTDKGREYFSIYLNWIEA